ncbi:biotin--[acetyl-CoA-carboxylase] ligase [Ferroacidibacillus organovorans]|uniref:biotin--[biotin carboxyl-carrier protein] ligase n=1 Tax=Ferroacidibacillus organovorans TaxID=1765683 RepID=A0A124IWB2_9BACL|nr:biotin--[acetyl-CoA-carboxylase] ligase [Ferroacidibacillus organovorans]KUO96844.1 hypothetical protein ATW55_08530 [Ferroacidibacillus organovorans]
MDKLDASVIERDLKRMREGGRALREGAVLVFPSVTSTNDIARDTMLHDHLSWVAILAEEQTAGRGRRGRNWISQPGNGLFFSYAHAIQGVVIPDAWPLLVALCVRDTLAELVHSELTVKWPNDILAEGKKVCGILTEARQLADRAVMITGIGVNVRLDLERTPEDVKNRATSFETLGETVDRNRLASALIHALTLLKRDVAAGLRFGDRVDAYRASCETLGKHVRAVHGNTVLEGVAEAIDEHGTLFMRDRTGNRHALFSGEIVETAPLERMRTSP